MNTLKPGQEKSALTEEEEAELATLDTLLKEDNPDIFKEFEQIKSEHLDGVASDIEVEQKQSKLLKAKEFLVHRFFKIRTITKLKLLNAYYSQKKILTTQTIKIKHNFSTFCLKLIDGFKTLPRKQKVKMIALTVVILLIPFGIWFSVTKFLDFATPVVVTDLSEYADSVIDLKANEPTENFLRPSRIPPNIFLIKRFVTNIVGQGESDTPMIAAEIYLEALNPHSLAEIKSRESYFRDTVISFTNQWTYEELVTREGKERFLNALKDELQSKIKKGKLSKIYFKSIILKP